MEGTVKRKPVIGLNSDLRAANGDAPSFSYVAANYFDSLAEVGCIPIVLPPISDEGYFERVLEMVDGLLFIGGADLDPRRDGFMRHPTTRLLDRRREVFDRKLMQQAVDQRLPVFGIGAGMQLLNVCCGGNLYLHLSEDMPDALPHQDAIDSAHRHGLEVVPGTLMERVFGDGEIRVNSMHHMAVDEVPSTLQVTARCPDGIVEAVESRHPESWFALGTQFHPEAESASALDIRIFEEFAAAAAGSSVVAMA